MTASQHLVSKLWNYCNVFRDDFSMICYPRLNSRVIKGDVDDDVRKMLDIVRDVRISLSRRDDGEDGGGVGGVRLKWRRQGDD